MKYGLKDNVIEKICHVFGKFPEIEKAVLYGSRAKGNFRNGSDIDLTLFGDDLNLKKLYKIMDELDDLLLPYSFDLSIHSLIDDEEVLEHIQRVGVVFYQKG
jgi:predicted nucleotidyltransferase